jgi:23S rRNA (cytidine1920-2'-O)/16S rRNA (cytidine1409-2'-O)-methyltransferase
MKGTRLDQELVHRALAQSRESAKRLILAGEVLVGGHVADKPATPVDREIEIIVKQRPKFVSRGGLKLEAALDQFGIDVTHRIALDIGSSTGGFTDCLLQRGAKKVYAFDVGTNQLAWKLRNDNRVISREQFNCRNLSPDDVNEIPTIVVGDVSFISLTMILGPAAKVIAAGGEFVMLIKPQFELKREQIGKGGIVRDPVLHQQAIDKVNSFAFETIGIQPQGVIPSPIEGAAGNREFLAWYKA